LSKKIAILQSNYIPWKGYFDLINMVDEFILFDTVQYTKSDWRNRNKIKTSQGLNWITIPVFHSISQTIKDIKTTNNQWRKKHWKTITQSYSKSEYFKEYKDIFEDLYLNNNDEYLSQINYKFILTICKILGITTSIRWSNEFKLINGQSEQLLNICKDCNANTYISGPAASIYLDVELFKKKRIDVKWIDYLDYPQYSQQHPPFEHGVSVLDLIFNEGKNAFKFMNSFNQ